MSEAVPAPSFETFADGAALAEAAARVIAGSLAEAVGVRGRAAMVATGGGTPKGAYDRLARLPLEWDKVAITLSDERWVPPSDPESNEGMVRRRLLTGPAAAAGFTPLWSDAPTPEAAAGAAEPAVQALAPFDVVLLGMGDDGHIASLFPGSAALGQGLDPQSPRLCLGVPAGSPAPDTPRISLTLRALLSSRSIVLLISGEAKRRTVEAALDGADLPVRRLLSQSRTPVAILWAP